ncbi:TPA: hypothetical protein JTN83_002097 [Escherichia coli]|nr:hypothetical protein [Escherichia coli]HAX6704104.1 hypothetical protein [Escherichia coli]
MSQHQANSPTLDDLLGDYEFDQNGEPRMYEFDGKLYSQTEAIEAGPLTGGLSDE